MCCLTLFWVPFELTKTSWPQFEWIESCGICCLHSPMPIRKAWNTLVVVVNVECCWKLSNLELSMWLFFLKSHCEIQMARLRTIVSDCEALREKQEATSKQLETAQKLLEERTTSMQAEWVVVVQELVCKPGSCQKPWWKILLILTGFEIPLTFIV